jgi:hypothetical protein
MAISKLTREFAMKTSKAYSASGLSIALQNCDIAVPASLGDMDGKYPAPEILIAGEFVRVRGRPAVVRAIERAVDVRREHEQRRQAASAAELAADNWADAELRKISSAISAAA